MSAVKNPMLWYDDEKVWVKSAKEILQKEELAAELPASINDREILLNAMNAYNDIHYELNGAYLGLECAPYLDPEGFTLRMTETMIRLVGDKLELIPDNSLYVE